VAIVSPVTSLRAGADRATLLRQISRQTPCRTHEWRDPDRIERVELTFLNPLDLRETSLGIAIFQPRQFPLFVTPSFLGGTLDDVFAAGMVFGFPKLTPTRSR
jgi:hypothetical protein